MLPRLTFPADTTKGIQPPGYEERRRERLREKYGVEINPVSAQAS